jgi:D-3-phosphoglycerate dehydrogenase
MIRKFVWIYWIMSFFLSPMFFATARLKVDMVQANSLKIIARAGAGMDNIDCEYTESKSIISINAGEANSDAVAEQSLAMLLMLLNNEFH